VNSRKLRAIFGTLGLPATSQSPCKKATFRR
jgi:hypothetical protein